MKNFKHITSLVNTVPLKVLLVLLTMNFLSTAVHAVCNEDELSMEPWMATPFEVTDLDENMVIEQWMHTPFEVTDLDENMVIEQWMHTPFEALPMEKELQLEAWMVQPFTDRMAELPADHKHLAPDCQI